MFAKINTVMKLYPLQFESIFKDRIWGGTKLKTYLNKSITTDITGESWEISTVENEVSIIANGVYAGISLVDLIGEYTESVLGTKVYATYGNQFPLLFKYLDAREDLSIQLHPNDALAQKRHNTFGKTEMWYVMQADPDSRLIVGFKEQSNPEEYTKHVADKTILELLDTKKVKAGDVFFLATGTIHAIGAGILIAEIQQTSDITYRIYDFDRVDIHGNTRELHNDLALEAINYQVVDAQRTYKTLPNCSNTIVDCPYFTTNVIELDGTVKVSKTTNSFTVYMCVGGQFELTLEGEVYQYTLGDTILIPAFLTDFQLNGQATVLEIYIS